MSAEEYKAIVACTILNSHTLTSYYHSVPGFLDALLILRNLQKTYQNEIDRQIQNEDNIKYFLQDIKRICKKNMIELRVTKNNTIIKYTISGKDISDLIFYDINKIKKY